MSFRWYLSAAAIRQFMTLVQYPPEDEGPHWERARSELGHACGQASKESTHPETGIQLWNSGPLLLGPHAKPSNLQLFVSPESRKEGPLPQLVAVKAGTIAEESLAQLHWSIRPEALRGYLSLAGYNPKDPPDKSRLDRELKTHFLRAYSTGRVFDGARVYRVGSARCGPDAVSKRLELLVALPLGGRGGREVIRVRTLSKDTGRRKAGADAPRGATVPQAVAAHALGAARPATDEAADDLIDALEDAARAIRTLQRRFPDERNEQMARLVSEALTLAESLVDET
jgi:hypothetical protein